MSAAPFQALWFDGEDAGGRPVVVRSEGESVVLQSPDGATVTLPRRALRWAGSPQASRPMLETDDGRQLVLDSPGSTSDLGVPARRPTLVERVGASRAAAGGCVAALVAIVSLALAWLIPASVDLGKRFLPWSIEVMMGEEILLHLDRAYTTRSVLEPEKQARLRERFRVLARASGLDGARLEFRASARIGPNALALPGRIVVVTDGLVALMGESDRLDAVIAHELGHLAHRHALERLMRDSGYAFVLATVFHDANTVRSIARHAPALLLTTTHSREAERESDAFAIDLLRKTGRSGEDFAQAMEALRDLQATRADDGFRYLSSHPTTQERINAARAAR